jgi:hypothetical protein
MRAKFNSTAMGLAGGDHGVKKFVKTKFADALRDFPNIATAVKASGHSPQQAVVLLDGNVMINQVPSAVVDFDGYVRVFGGFIRQGLEAADSVFVVFDEPKNVSRAKLDEQKRRDLARAKTVLVMSSDMAQTFAPLDDDYGMETIERSNPHDILSHRKARPRFYDALCKRVMTELMSRKEYETKTLTFDGIDQRGASRSAESEREPGVFSSSDKIETLMSRGDGEAPIGEGDLKLTDIESEIQFLRNEGKLFKTVEIIFVCTIDTDSIAIELMHQSAKNEACRASDEEGCETGKPIKSVLCFRETTGKRKDSQEPPQTMHACLDMAILHDLVMAGLFGKAHVERQNHLHRGAMALLAAGWVLCGCDFCELKGMRSDVVWEAVVQIARDEPRLLKNMSHVWELTRKSTDAEVSEARSDMCEVVERLVNIAICKLSEMPRMSRAHASARLADNNDYKKASWVIMYWGGLEYKNLDDWGFAAP